MLENHEKLEYAIKVFCVILLFSLIVKVKSSNFRIYYSGSNVIFSNGRVTDKNKTGQIQKFDERKSQYTNNINIIAINSTIFLIHQKLKHIFMDRQRLIETFILMLE